MMAKKVSGVASRKFIGDMSPRSGRNNIAYGARNCEESKPVVILSEAKDLRSFSWSRNSRTTAEILRRAQDDTFRVSSHSVGRGSANVPLRGRGSILVISAPSGAGKSTLVRRLIGSLSDLAFSVSHTTRPRRQGEKEGRDYFFVTRRRFETLIAADEFVEWAEVFGHLYGTSKAQLERSLAEGRDVLLDIDVQGHRQVRKRLPDALSVFVLPPSFEELKRRLTKRHLDSPQDVERRLAAACQEISHWPEYDFLVVNDRLPRATQALRAIVQAGRLRRQIQAPRAQEICRTFGG